MASDYRFSFGPWNISEGADPFGPTVRPTIEFSQKLASYKALGFEGVQLHDDDAVPNVDNKTGAEIEKEAKEDGYTTMKQDGIIKILEGLTTIEEVERVTEDDSVDEVIGAKGE